MNASDSLLLKIWNEIVDARNILIFPHDLPDGDAIGSSVAIALLAKRMGKKAHIFVYDKIPDNLLFLDSGDLFLCDRDEVELVYSDIDVALMLDGGDPERISDRADVFFSAGKTLCIDHHKTESDDFADLKYCDSSAAATGQLIYRMLRLAGVDIDPEIGLPIFTAIMTDTGCFQYSNTNSEIFSIAGELYDLGVDMQKSVTEIYQSNSPEKVKLHADIISKVEFLSGGRLGFAHVSQAMLKEAGASMEDSEGVVEEIRNIKGVELSILIKEMNDNLVKVSMRAKSYIDVSCFAESYGGGGHIRASGFSLDLPLTEAVSAVKSAITEYVETNYKIDKQQSFYKIDN